MQRFEFQAMGGITEVLAMGAPSAGERIARLFHDYEQRLSRFLPWSELCALNRTAGTGSAFLASHELFDAIRLSLDWAERTDGLFDPTILPELEACGYDRPFDALRVVGGQARTGQDSSRRGRWRGIVLRATKRSIQLPPEVRLDLGGIGKGYTVDAAFRCLGSSVNAIVNASGDLFAAGDGPDGEGWVIGVEDPARPGEDVCALRVKDRGVATSGPGRRSWWNGDRRYHHLIDARIGLPHKSDVLQATVVAADAASADVLAKVAYFAGSARAIALAGRFGVACVVVTHDRGLVASESMAEYLV